MQVLACIGEQFTEGDEVCGVAVNIRGKGDRIELWTKTASNEAVQVRAIHLSACPMVFCICTCLYLNGHAD